jgi:hypothetical protein
LSLDLLCLAQKILQRSLQSLEKPLRREDDCMLRFETQKSGRHWTLERENIELALLISIRHKRFIHQPAKLDDQSARHRTMPSYQN